MMKPRVFSMQTVSSEEYQRWLDEHTLVEKDRRGPKVLQCDNGDYLKLFRIKHRISSARLFNPARRFCSHAQRLAALGIPTLKPLELYHIPHVDRWAVRYAPLAGETVRCRLIRQSTLSETALVQLGVFIAQLHNKGIYFRSLHPGNVVFTPEGKLGLIDVLDCRFNVFDRSLSAAQRERNFSHFFRYDDAKLLRDSLLAAYQSARQNS